MRLPAVGVSEQGVLHLPPGQGGVRAQEAAGSRAGGVVAHTCEPCTGGRGRWLKRAVKTVPNPGVGSWDRKRAETGKQGQFSSVQL